MFVGKLASYTIFPTPWAFFFAAAGHPHGGGVVSFSSSLIPMAFLSFLLTH